MRWCRLRAGAALGVWLSLCAAAGSAQTVNIPEGFTPLFDGKTLKGWHWSLTNHHGSTGKATSKTAPSRSDSIRMGRAAYL